MFYKQRDEKLLTLFLNVPQTQIALFLSTGITIHKQHFLIMYRERWRKIVKKAAYASDDDAVRRITLII